ncbi:mannose-1-phosphate guanylyltransferase/mannose-6-phosphate isomerase [Porticoccaceae bacterium LTM1]|nr:mannose-1-phosphate guanylyltransferase/mannose-6-phosphate isomerase [Porticoccaceae bacterium LTM1]
MLIPVILSGGAGTRLWPLSRQRYPKQCLPLLDDNLSLLQQTVQRLSACDDMAEPIVVCHEEHRFLIAEQLRQVDVKPAAIMLEPVARNTAPALALAAHQALKINENATLLVLPADHFIEDKKAFAKAVNQACLLAQKGHLVAMGVKAQSPHTGYGYIRSGEALAGGEGSCITRFVEKPTLEKAAGFIDSGDYCWNSGMFVFPAVDYLSELESFEPDIAKSAQAAFLNAENDLDFIRLPLKPLESCPTKSIDYAVMERTERAALVSLDCGWRDIGEWQALWDQQPRDERGNICSGQVVTEDVSNSYIRAESRLVAVLGLDNQVVVETADAVLVMDRSRAQDVRAIVKQLESGQRSELQEHRTVYRPWGSYERLVSGPRFQVKRLMVKPGAALSLQRHKHRAEHWVVVRGVGEITSGDKTFLLNEDQSTYIPVGTCHRLANPGMEPLELIEVQTGAYLGEDDIERFEDIYGRGDC